MSALTLLLLAVGLAMDAFSVSLCSGLSGDRVPAWRALRLAGFFGGFQALMPILGWWGGGEVSRLLGHVDHWIAFALLAVVGGRMIYSAARGLDCPAALGSMTLATLLALSVATSIDALAVGLSLALVGVSITLPALLIGLVTFSLSLVGIYLGRRFGLLLGRRVEVLGGIILIAIGARIVYSHYWG